MSEAAFLGHLSRGGELVRTERMEEARLELESALALHPEDTKVRNLLGLVYFRLAAFPEALAVYAGLASERPGDAALRLNLGLIHLKMEAVDSAIAELERARDLDPRPSNRQRAIGYLGLAYARQGEYERAQAAFLEAGQPELAHEMEQALTRASLGSLGDELEPASTPRAREREPHRGLISRVDEASQEVSFALRAARPLVPAEAAVGAGDGHEMPIAVASYAGRDLVRPEEGNVPFEIGPGGVLIVRVANRIYSRTDGVVVSGGKLTYEPAVKRMRGRMTTEPFGSELAPMFVVSGHGHLVAQRNKSVFAALQFSDDVAYFREELLFAFEDRLRWENGGVPGSNGSIAMVQLRGEGYAAIRSRRALLGVKLAADRVLYIDCDVLAGWLGRIVPRLIGQGGDSASAFVECSGEGVILIEPTEGAP